MSLPLSAQGTILLVDDNPAIFTMYRDVLPVMSPYTILTAHNGFDALEQVEDHQHNGNTPPLRCIVIDVMMPVLDGIQLVRALRGDPATADIPLVILTALAQDQQRFTGLASGADQYLTKPVNVPDLLAAINTAIGLSLADRQQRLHDLANTPE